MDSPMTSTGISIKGYVAICRISNLPSVWTNVLCACLLAGGAFSWPGYLIPALAMSCIYLAGMCLNDLCDAAFDATHRPGRPIPSGAVSRGEALLLAVSLTVIGSGLMLAAGNLRAFLATLCLIGVIIWYDLDHKENPCSVLLMAACRLLLFVATALSVAGHLSANVLLAGGAHFAYILCLSLVARFENERGVPFTYPVIPLMLAAIPLLDGVILALLVGPWWLLAGLAGAVMMREGQKYVRGD